MFFPKSDFQKKKRPLPGCWSQSSGVGMHQNPHFQLKPVKNWKILKIRVRSTIAIPDSAWWGTQVQGGEPKYMPGSFISSASAADLLDSRVGWIDPRRIRWIFIGFN